MNIILPFFFTILATPSFASNVGCKTDGVARTLEAEQTSNLYVGCYALNVCANAVVTDHGPNSGCFTYEFVENAENGQDLYLRTKSGICFGDETTTLSWTCPSPEIISVTGYWATGSFSSVPVQVTYSYGTTHTTEVDDVNTWSQSVTKSMSGSFGVTSSIGISDEVDTQTTQAVSQGSSDVLTTSENDSYTYSVVPGQVWQWTWLTVDTDGNSTSRTNDLVVTNGTYAVPCCIPGYFTDPTNPTGSCSADLDGAVYKLC